MYFFNDKTAVILAYLCNCHWLMKLIIQTEESFEFSKSVCLCKHFLSVAIF